MNNKNNIKLVATDIDGVWTDAKMHYTDNGDFMKSFSTYDGMAVSLLDKVNIPVAILTSENSTIVKQRAKKLGIVAGKDPMGIAAAALYLACISSGGNKTQKEISIASGVTEVTIRNRCAGLKKLL